MITLKKIQIYNKYDGHIDLWAQFGTSQEKKTINDSDWFLIEDLVQDVFLLEEKKAAKLYLDKIETKMKLAGVNDEIYNEILKLASS